MKTLSVLLLYFTFCHSANILGIFNHPGKSHTFLGKVLLKNLADKGHHVVMISSFPMKNNISNYRDINLPENLKDLERRNMMYFNQDKQSSIKELRNMTLQHTENTFNNQQVKNLLQSNETFDVIVMDWFFNEATLIFGHIYKAPIIYISSFGNMALLNDVTGNTLPFSYVPGAGMFIHDDMTFRSRIIMTLFNIVYKLLLSSRNQAHFELLKRHFEDPPPIEKLQENVALVLANSHFSFETPRPYTPNVIPVGGFHIQSTKTIRQELKEFLDSANEGVIYFSLGSQILSKNLDKKIFSHILKALGKVKYKILWKYEGDDLSDMSNNIKISKWIPQMEVLAHPNVKLFLTHGGMLSFIEAVYYHVPVICIPFNGDQLTNAAFIESRNLGRHIFPNEITEDGLLDIIEEVLSNPIYQEQMKFRSALLREQSESPMDQAVFWVEHVVKHKGGHHLKTFATKLPWYKYYLIDVIGFFLCVTTVFITIVLLFCKYLYLKANNTLNKRARQKTE